MCGDYRHLWIILVCQMVSLYQINNIPKISVYMSLQL